MSDSFSDSQSEDWLSIAGRLANASISLMASRFSLMGFLSAAGLVVSSRSIGSPGTASQGVFSAVLSQQFYDDLSPATDKRLHTIIHRKSENDNLLSREIFFDTICMTRCKTLECDRILLLPKMPEITHYFLAYLMHQHVAKFHK